MMRGLLATGGALARGATHHARGSVLVVKTKG